MEEKKDMHRLSDPNNRRTGPNLSTGEFTYLNGDIYKGQYHVDEYGKYMSGRFTTSESKELIKIGDALDVNNKLELSIPVPKNSISTSNSNDDYINYKIIRRYEGNVEKVIFGTINERIPEVEGQNKNKYSAEDISKANKPKLKVNLKGIKYVPISYKLQGTSLSVDPGYYFVRPEKVIVSDFVISKLIDANFNYFIGANEQALTDISVCLIPNNETLEVMMFERNKTYNDVISIEKVDFSELSTYPLGTFVKIAEVGARPLEGYTYYFINTNNNGNCVDLSSSWTPAVRKKVRNIIDPVVPIINNIPSNCCEDKEPIVIIVSGSEGKAGKDGKDGINVVGSGIGLPGAPGAAGKDGKDGKDGQPGTNGTPGRNGNDGQPGTNGTPGNRGNDGIPGTNGTPGKDGTPGNRGNDGIPGTNGTPGKDGICPDCPKDNTGPDTGGGTGTGPDTGGGTGTGPDTGGGTGGGTGTGTETGNKYWKVYSCDSKKGPGYTSVEPLRNQIYFNISNQGLYYWDGSNPEFLKTIDGITLFTSLTKMGGVTTCPGSGGGSGPSGGKDVTIYALHPCDGQGEVIYTYQKIDTIGQIATLTTGLTSYKTYQYRGGSMTIKETELGSRKVTSVSIEIGNLECSTTGGNTGGGTGGSTGGGSTGGGGGGGSTGGGGDFNITGEVDPCSTLEFANSSNIVNNQNQFNNQI